MLEDLGRNITAALGKLSAKTVVDEEALKECMNDISRALMGADVNIRLVSGTLGCCLSLPDGFKCFYRRRMCMYGGR